MSVIACHYLLALDDEHAENNCDSVPYRGHYHEVCITCMDSVLFNDSCAGEMGLVCDSHNNYMYMYIHV